MSQGYGFAATKPVSVWNKPLKADFKSLFKALSKAVGHGVTGKWDELAADAAESLSAIGFETDPGQLAWLLIRRSLTRATFDLAKENVRFLALTADSLPDQLCDQLDLSLEQTQIAIDRDFFEHPREFPILKKIKVPFDQWLRAFGLSNARADSISARLPSYFVFALNQE